MNTITSADRVAVLMYHEIRTSRNTWERRYCVTPTRFHEHVRALRAAGYLPCSLADFRAWAINQGNVPPNTILLTFDDGYAGVFEHAYPLLRRNAFPFSVFVVSGAIGGTDTWTQHTSPDHNVHPLMSRAQLVELASAGVAVGSHSRSHADLASLGALALRDEVYGSRVELEDLLGRRVDCFAYPYGRLNGAVRAAVAEAGYTCAFTTRSGFNRAGQDTLLIRRIDVYGTDTPNMLLRKLRLGTNDGSLMSAARYFGRRALVRGGLLERR